MKRYIVIIFAFLLSACTPVTQRAAAIPTATATPTPLPTSCTLYELKNWTEYNKAKNGSFADVMLWDYPSKFLGTTGVTVMLTLRKPEIDWIKQLNTNSVKSYSWAVAPTGAIYFDIPDGSGGYLDNNLKVQWNRIAFASGENDPVRNRVCVSRIVNGYGSIVGVPYQASGDYLRFSKYDWLVQPVRGEYGAVPTLFYCPLFDSTTGYLPLSKGNSGMWIPIDWFYKSDGVFQIPPDFYGVATATPQVPSTPTGSPTIAPATGTPTLLPPSTLTPVFTRTPECHYFGNINNAVCVP